MAYVYQVVEEDVNEMSQAELDVKLQDAIEQEDYDLAAEIRDLKQYSEVNYAEEITRILKENAKLPEGEQQDLTLDDALKQLGKTRNDLEKFITKRVDEEFKLFNRDINEEFYTVNPETGAAILELPKFLSKGVERKAS